MIGFGSDVTNYGQHLVKGNANVGHRWSLWNIEQRIDD